MEASFGIAPHKEAVELLKGKRPVEAKVFYEMLPELRGRAFAVTGLEGANVLQRVRDALAAVPAGMNWEDAKADILEELDAAHFSEAAAERRSELLLRVNTFQAFSSSIWRVAQEDDDTTHLQYIHGDIAKVPTPSHVALDGIVLPKGDPFWNTHTGPWGHLGCVCYVRPMNEDLVDEERQKDREKIASGKPPENANVIEGKRLEGLRNGGFDREGKHFDVSPPEQPGAFRWHPDDLRLPIGQLKERYDAPVWEAFELWARKNLAFEKTTVWDWLNQKHDFLEPDAATAERNRRKTQQAIEQRKRLQA